VDLDGDGLMGGSGLFTKTVPLRWRWRLPRHGVPQVSVTTRAAAIVLVSDILIVDEAEVARASSRVAGDRRQTHVCVC
jgi:hypothetical protein